MGTMTGNNAQWALSNNSNNEITRPAARIKETKTYLTMQDLNQKVK